MLGVKTELEVVFIFIFLLNLFFIFIFPFSGARPAGTTNSANNQHDAGVGSGRVWHHHHSHHPHYCWGVTETASARVHVVPGGVLLTWSWDNQTCQPQRTRRRGDGVCCVCVCVCMCVCVCVRVCVCVCVCVVVAVAIWVRLHASRMGCKCEFFCYLGHSLRVWGLFSSFFPFSMFWYQWRIFLNLTWCVVCFLSCCCICAAIFIHIEKYITHGKSTLIATKIAKTSIKDTS